ncbi:hypothetical protein U9M48_034365 [Paspalum notatum var. saurae]|uniref:Uncharacterized protein n=1 Tax=Paspalum notatum var. saurae TaxID=547442 RepID=A0AAQ3U9V9_PASNO
MTTNPHSIGIAAAAHRPPPTTSASHVLQQSTSSRQGCGATRTVNVLQGLGRAAAHRRLRAPAAGPGPPQGPHLLGAPPVDARPPSSSAAATTTPPTAGDISSATRTSTPSRRCDASSAGTAQPPQAACTCPAAGGGGVVHQQQRQPEPATAGGFQHHTTVAAAYSYKQGARRCTSCCAESIPFPQYPSTHHESMTSSSSPSRKQKGTDQDYFQIDSTRAI